MTDHVQNTARHNKCGGQYMFHVPEITRELEEVIFIEEWRTRLTMISITET